MGCVHSGKTQMIECVYRSPEGIPIFIELFYWSDLCGGEHPISHVLCPYCGHHDDRGYDWEMVFPILGLSLRSLISKVHNNDNEKWIINFWTGNLFNEWNLNSFYYFIFLWIDIFCIFFSSKLMTSLDHAVHLHF